VSISVVKETVDYTWVVARQLDRVAEAASSINTDIKASMRKTLLRYYYALRQLVTLVRPVLNLDCSDVLDKVLAKLHDSNADLIEIYKVLDEIEAKVLEGLMRKHLLIRTSVLRVEE